MGITIYQNGGLFIILIIVLGLWSNGEKLDEGVLMSLLAMVFYIYVFMN